MELARVNDHEAAKRFFEEFKSHTRSSVGEIIRERSGLRDLAKATG